MRIGNWLAAAAVVVLSAAAAQAGTIDTRPASDPSTTGTGAPIFGQTFVADDVNLVSFTFQFVTIAPMVVTGEVWSVAAGLPSAVLFTSAPQVVLNGFPFVDYTFFADFALTSGTTYAIVARALGGPGGIGFTGNVYGGGTEVFSLDGGSTWGLAGANDLTVQIVMNNKGIVTPEPGTYALFGIGLAGLGLAVLRRRSAAKA